MSSELTPLLGIMDAHNVYQADGGLCYSKWYLQGTQDAVPESHESSQLQARPRCGTRGANRGAARAHNGGSLKGNSITHTSETTPRVHDNNHQSSNSGVSK